MRFYCILILSLLLSGSSFSQSDPSTKPASGFSIDNIDKTLDPCVDFFQYACGNWLKKAEIPADLPRWGSFAELHERNQAELRDILDKSAVVTPNRHAIDQKIGDFYSSCMDEKATNAAGVSAIKPLLDVPDEISVIDIMCCGPPAKPVYKRWKKDLSEIISWDRYDRSHHMNDEELEEWIKTKRHRVMYRSEENVD